MIEAELCQPVMKEKSMKHIILVATCILALSTFSTVAAFAQSTGPAAQSDNMTKKASKKSGMKKGMKPAPMGQGGSDQGGPKTGVAK